MPEILYRRQGLREALYDLFADLPTITIARVAVMPSERPAGWLDLGIEYKMPETDQGDDGIWAVQWFLKIFVDAASDMTGSGAVDLAIDKAIDEIDVRLGGWQGSEPFTTLDGRTFCIPSIEKVSAIPAPNDKDGKGVITYPGLIKFIEVS